MFEEGVHRHLTMWIPRQSISLCVPEAAVGRLPIMKYFEGILSGIALGIVLGEEENRQGGTFCQQVGIWLKSPG